MTKLIILTILILSGIWIFHPRPKTLESQVFINIPEDYPFNPCDLETVSCDETPTPNSPSLPSSKPDSGVKLHAASSVANESNRFLATVTKYTLTETNENGGVMASGKYVYLGAVACPRKYPLGQKILIAEDAYTCEDRTSLRYDGRFDIYEVGYQKALNFGKQQLEVTILK